MLAKKHGLSSVSAGVACAYTVFIVIGFLFAYAISGGYVSSVLVMAAIAQCLGVVFLCIQLMTTKIATGISAKSVALDGLSIAFRLTCTVWLNAYIPEDPTGDALYQMIEAFSLLLSVWLFWSVKAKHKHTYQADEDCGNVLAIATVCLMLAALLHTNLADSPVFDTMWMTGLFVGTIAVVPQLVLICRTGGRVQALTSHYIVALALSRVLTGVVMWFAADELFSDPWIYDFNHGKWAIFVAVVLQTLLVADFIYHYVRSAILHGFRCTLELPTSALSGTDWSKARWV